MVLEDLRKLALAGSRLRGPALEGPHLSRRKRARQTAEQRIEGDFARICSNLLNEDLPGELSNHICSWIILCAFESYVWDTKVLLVCAQLLLVRTLENSGWGFCGYPSNHTRSWIIFCTFESYVWNTAFLTAGSLTRAVACGRENSS